MIWGTALHPGEVYNHAVSRELHLTLASIEIRPSKYVDRAPPLAFLVLRTTAFENVICTLGKGQTYQQSLDLVFEEGEELTFQVEGTGIVYITGYLSAHPTDPQHREACQDRDTTSGLPPRIRVQDGTVHAGQTPEASLEANPGTAEEEYCEVIIEEEEKGEDLSGTPVVGGMGSLSEHLDKERHVPRLLSPLESIKEEAPHSEDTQYSVSSHREVMPRETPPSPETTPSRILSLQDHHEGEKVRDPKGPCLLDDKATPDALKNISGWCIKEEDEDSWHEELGLDETDEGWCEEEGGKVDQSASRNSKEPTEDRGECRANPSVEYVTVAGPHEEGGKHKKENKVASLPVSHQGADGNDLHTSAPANKRVCGDETEYEATSNPEQQSNNVVEEGIDDRTQGVGDRPGEKRKLDEAVDMSDLGDAQVALSIGNSKELGSQSSSVGSGSIEGGFRCETCGRGFVDQPHLERHRKLHSIIRPYKCQFCSKCYASKANVIIHERTHTGVRPFRCQYCGKGFAQKSALLVHERIHTGYKPHRCQFCGKGFTQKQHLTAHQRTHKDSAIKCRVCNLPFSESAALSSHLKTHEEDGLSACTECGDQFPDIASLKKHEKTHRPHKQFSCKLCDHVFGERSVALAHEKSHSEVQPFHCKDCNNYFESEIVLKGHVRKRHTHSRLFKCQYCEKSYSQRVNLIHHERVHTGERPFNCRYCGKGFRMKYTCGVHERTHTGERPFQCKVCGKAFKQSGHMLAHKKTHQK